MGGKKGRVLFCFVLFWGFWSTFGRLWPTLVDFWLTYGRFREPTKQNTADSVVRSGKDSDGIRAVFCFVLFWGKVFRSISDMAGHMAGQIVSFYEGLHQAILWLDLTSDGLICLLIKPSSRLCSSLHGCPMKGDQENYMAPL